MRRNAFQLVVSLIAASLALFLMAAPVLAHHKDGHEGGNKSSEWNEDNDTNDGGTPNNIPDDGDNNHPSGKDRSTENGNSGNQGNSSSDPDDDGRGPDRSNGGPDKPNGSGGKDKADQDNNNGCGNDDDFEDDNEGWCGSNPKAKGSKGGNSTSNGGGGNNAGGNNNSNAGGNNNSNAGGNGNNSGGNGGNDVSGSGNLGSGKITICHATGSTTNPFVTITISVNGLNGHGDHAGDIIPAPEGGCAVVAGMGSTPAGVSIDGSTPQGFLGGGDDEGGLSGAAPDLKADGALPDVDVLGSTIVREDAATPGTEVKASFAQRAAEALGAALPMTGTSLLVFLGAALGLIGAGLAFFRTRRSI